MYFFIVFEHANLLHILHYYFTPFAIVLSEAILDLQSIITQG